MRAVVVGGGIAGLAAARRLEALVPDADVVLVERDAVLGGKIRTECVDGYVIEAAPDSFLSRKERGVGLCEELGLSDELVGRRSENRGTFVRRGRDLRPLPEGLTGMIPTSLDALEASDLLSPDGKARFAAESDVPQKSGDGDESIGSFVSRRFGREAYEALVEPLMTGIYGGDGDRLSLAATFPRLRALELEHGSVLRGLLHASPEEGARPPFLSLKPGMATLAESLAASLSRTRVVTGRAARRLTSDGSGFRLELDDGSVVDADALLLGTPAFATAELLGELAPELADIHGEIAYASSVVVTLAYREQDVDGALEGYGYVVPRVEESDVLACTCTSSKWEGRAPAGTVLVRVYAGRFGGRDLTDEFEADLVMLARDELELSGIEAEPIMTRVHRWPRGMPQYLLGHPERLARMEVLLEDVPGVALAGAAYHGVGIPDCIRSGEDAAESVARTLAGAAA